MTTLREMNERMQGWMAEKPSFTSGLEYYPQKDDLVLFQFVANGDDGPNFIMTYRAHVIETFTKTGKRTNAHRYCPVANNDQDAQCGWCEIGHNEIKERMSIYMYVDSILHTTMTPEKPFPRVEYEGRIYYAEEVKGFKLWNTSAWRDSPWNDIVKNFEIYKGLHNFSAQLIVQAAGLDRRYKVFALPNSAGLAPEIYEKAKQELTPLPKMLHDQMATPVSKSPQEASSAQTAGQAAQEVRPFAPSFAAPSNAPATPFTFGQPVSSSIPPPMTTVEVTTPSEPAPVEPTLTSEEDNRRPLKSLF